MTESMLIDAWAPENTKYRETVKGGSRIDTGEKTTIKMRSYAAYIEEQSSSGWRGKRWILGGRDDGYKRAAGGVYRWGMGVCVWEGREGRL